MTNKVHLVKILECGSCKYWKQTGTRTKAFDGWHYSSNIGVCKNYLVKDLVFSVPCEDLQITILTHQNEFDESFGCKFHEKRNHS